MALKELGWRIGDVLHTRPENVQRSAVDCGTCPVNLQCIAGLGGNGWRFDCCNSIALEMPTDGGGRVLLIIDCETNRFEKRDRATDFSKCPLCDGDIVKSDINNMTEHHRYLPTVHAKHPVATRVALWKAKIPEALDLKKKIAERNKRK